MSYDGYLKRHIAFIERRFLDGACSRQIAGELWTAGVRVPGFDSRRESVRWAVSNMSTNIGYITRRYFGRKPRARRSPWHQIKVTVVYEGEWTPELQYLEFKR